jgi:hypothetical protein
MITRKLASNLRDDGIISVAVDPGLIQTEASAEAVELTCEQSAKRLLKVIDGLTLNQSGRSNTWDGAEHPW